MTRPLSHILVTGGAGFIGSAFIRTLFSKEDFTGEIVNLDLLTYAGNLKNLVSVEEEERYHFVRGDIGETKLLLSLCDMYHIDTIVHFAAETHVDRSIAAPAAFIKTNVEGTFSLLELLRKRPQIHFHHISTDEVYGSLGMEGAFSEQSPYRPNSPYAATKAASDHLVRSFAHTYGLSATISHCSNNYGPCQFPEKLIPLVITRCMEGRSIPLYGEGLNRREWLFVEDHADAIWAILQRGKSGEVYDIGGGIELTNLELIHLICELFAEEKKQPKETYLSLIQKVQDRPGHDFRYAIDDRKIRNELGWSPHHPLREGLLKTIPWYLQQKKPIFAD